VSEEGFLSRWSRRKRAAGDGREEVTPVAAPLPPDAAPAAEAAPGTAPAAVPLAADAPVAPPAQEAEEPAFDPASLPPIESLSAESDFTAFLRKGVPEPLRRAALRKAWGLDPAIRDFVGLADYDWDFNAPDGVPGFALDLGGDVAKLLAQAVGLDRFDAPEGEGGSGAARPAAGGDAPEAASPDIPPPAEAAPAIAEVAAPAEADPADAAPPRRHGSALPS
jgi:hypothetical protein